MATALLDGLNDAQRQAVTAGEGPMLVLAGPGSGKTRVLTHRIAYLIQEMNIYPDHIVAVTFTNKAAAEMRFRVEKLLAGAPRGLMIGTFHAICARLLRREHQHHDYGSDYLIYDTDDQMELMTRVLAELNVDVKKFPPRQILGAISSAKNELIIPSEYQAPMYFGEIVARAYPRYQNLLIENNAMDFDDLLMNMVLLMRKNAEVKEKYQRMFEYMLVDEFQDTNTAQYQLVKLLAAPQNNVFVVGDEDQAIYAFRGADYRNVANFRRDFPTARVILLEDNYRSTQIVLDVARAVIDKNVRRTPKHLQAARGVSGTRATIYEAYDQDDEARYVVKQIKDLRKRFAYRDFSVMYRTNAQSRALEEAMVAAGIPNRVIGGVGFYKRREVRDLLAYMRIVNNPNDTVSFNRVINVPKRSIGKKSMEDFIAWTAKEKINYTEALERLMRGDPSTLSPKVAKQFADFSRMLVRWREVIKQEGSDLLTLFDEIRNDLGYSIYIRDELSKTLEEVREREENVEELRNVVVRDKDKPLNEFVSEIALVSDVDALREDADAVTLMTLHAAKGLEFPVVFLTGLEEGIIPHMRSVNEPEGMEEERRLLYVDVTRAEELIFLTYAFRRMTFGRSDATSPSRFLMDVPLDLTDGVSTKLSASSKEQNFRRQTTWDSPPRRQDDISTVDGRAYNPKIIPFGKTNAMPPQKPLQFRSGQRVSHDKFGEGIVIATRRAGDDEEISVRFEKAGMKTLIASLARLTVLKG
jgi:DNA helicase II / ATP-dependent DNA helicase PcrA